MNVNLTMQTPCKVICVYVPLFILPDAVRLDRLATPRAGPGGGVGVGGLEKKEEQKQVKENKTARTVGFFSVCFLVKSLSNGC